MGFITVQCYWQWKNINVPYKAPTVKKQQVDLTEVRNRPRVVELLCGRTARLTNTSSYRAGYLIHFQKDYIINFQNGFLLHTHSQWKTETFKLSLTLPNLITTWVPKSEEETTWHPSTYKVSSTSRRETSSLHLNNLWHQILLHARWQEKTIYIEPRTPTETKYGFMFILPQLTKFCRVSSS